MNVKANKRRLILASAAFAVLLSAGKVRADYNDGENGPKKWEFGVDPGMMYPVSGGQFGHSIDNAVLVNMLNNQGETIAEEVGEGFVSPPEPGYSTIASSLEPMPELAMHVDYRLDSMFTVGVQGGYDFRTRTMIDQQGIWDRHWLSLRDESWMLHAAPVVRVGRTFGSLRPTLTFGPEWTILWEQASVSYTDPDDSIPPMKVVNQMNSYFGVVGGAGLEWYCTEHGSLQLGVAYHKVFGPGGKFDYVTPQFSFIARF